MGKIKNKTCVLTLALALASVLVLLLIASASTTGAANMEVKSTNRYTYIDQGGNELIFPSKDEYSFYVKLQKSRNMGDRWEKVGTPTKAYLKNYFVDYLSSDPVWANASQYEIEKGKNLRVRSNYNWENVNLDLGFRYSFSVATTILADSSMCSRLGVYADYTLTQEEYAQYTPEGKSTGQKYKITYATRTATYMGPVYK